ncbi:hypothetical protein ACFHW2_28480 [Actinomadura sp. LOL_016]
MTRFPGARERCDLLDERYPRERRVAEFAEQLREEQHTIAAPADLPVLP